MRDTGIGIAPEHQKQIFQEFWQVNQGTARRYGGTGLGLSISQRLVQPMQGSLSVESQSGQGALLRIEMLRRAASPEYQASECFCEGRNTERGFDTVKHTQTVNEPAMPDHSIIVIGASAGGVEALVELVKRLPRHFSAAIFVAVHFPASSISLLPQILSRLDTLPAHHPLDQEPIRSGQIYIAPPNHHLIIQTGIVHLSHDPRENGHRPAIDTLFRSAAYAYGSQVIGVILTGTLEDGTAGLLTIKTLGGLAIVQDPKEALFDGMPCSAIETVSVDWVLTIAEIAQLLVELVEQPIERESQAYQEGKNQEGKAREAAVSHRSDPIPDESQQVTRSQASLERGEQPGNVSPLTCPDCGGVLWELQDSSMVRYRCHVGHAYSIDSLAEEQIQDVEKSLWTAVRALEEKAALARRMAVHAREQDRARSAEQFEARASAAHQHATVIRQLILRQLSQQATAHSDQETGHEKTH